MRKTLSLLLVIAMLLSMCACGANEETEKNSVQASSEATSLAQIEESTNETVFESVNLEQMESAEETITEEQVSEDEIVGVWFDKATSRKLEIRSAYEMEFWDTMGMSQPGSWKYENNVLSVNQITLPSELVITKIDGIVHLTGDKFDFVKWQNVDKVNVTQGELTGNDSVNIMLNNVEFVDSVPSEIINGLFLNDATVGEGMVLAKITVEITNKSMNEITIGDIDETFSTFLDYNNGYLYSSRDGSASYYQSGNDVVQRTWGGANGYAITIASLQTRTVDIYIECPELIATDVVSPLAIVFIPMFEGHTDYFQYVIR